MSMTKIILLSKSGIFKKKIQTQITDMEKSRRGLMKSIGLVTAVGSGFANISSASLSSEDEGFGTAVYFDIEKLRRNPSMRDCIEAPALATENIGDQIKVQKSVEFYEDKIEYSGSLTQEDFETSDLKRRLDQNVERAQNQRSEQLLELSRSENIPSETITLGSDAQITLDETYPTISNPPFVANTLPPTVEFTDNQDEHYVDMSLHPTGGNGTISAEAWRVAGITVEPDNSSFSKRSSSSTGQVAEITNASASERTEWDGYLFNLSNGGSVSIFMEVEKLSNYSTETEELYSKSLPNGQQNVVGSDGPAMTKFLDGNEDYIIRIIAKMSVSVLGAGSSVDFGQVTNNRGQGERMDLTKELNINF